MPDLSIVAICLEHTAAATHAAAGIPPITSPPLTQRTYRRAILESADLIYIKLHGQPNQPYWTNAGQQRVINYHQIAATNLTGKTILLAACHTTQTSPMLQALIKANAAAIIYGDGENYTGITKPAGADILFTNLRQLLAAGIPTLIAYNLARNTPALLLTDSGRDTRNFRLCIPTKKPATSPRPSPAN